MEITQRCQRDKCSLSLSYCLKIVYLVTANISIIPLEQLKRSPTMTRSYRVL